MGRAAKISAVAAAVAAVVTVGATAAAGGDNNKSRGAGAPSVVSRRRCRRRVVVVGAAAVRVGAGVAPVPANSFDKVGGRYTLGCSNKAAMRRGTGSLASSMVTVKASSMGSPCARCAASAETV